VVIRGAHHLDLYQPPPAPTDPIAAVGAAINHDIYF
jgi:hypothetical protein